jgi:hypothetical protein
MVFRLGVYSRTDQELNVSYSLISENFFHFNLQSETNRV